MAPWCIGYLWRHCEHWAFIEKHNLEAWAVTVFTAVILGLMLENLGTTIEVCIFDRLITRDTEYENHKTHESDWYDYLRLAFKTEPVGHRQLQRLVLHLRFERNVCVAFAFAAIGCLCLPIPRGGHIEVAALMLLLAILMFWEAKRSHRALSELRHQLLKGFRVVGNGSAEGDAHALNAGKLLSATTPDSTIVDGDGAGI